MEDLTPSQYYLGQNFPNPFKEITIIKYCLPVKSKVKLTIYNSDNKKVKNLVNNIQEAGTYEINLDSHDLLDNYYYYELKAIGLPLGLNKIFSGMKRMLLLR